MKTDDGRLKGKISLYCYALNVSRQGFYDYLNNKNKPYKYEKLLAAMKAIINEDEYNDTYGRLRMYQALIFKKNIGKISFDIPSENTIRNIMIKNNLIHKPRRKPHGITKADREARKSDDKLKRDFKSDIPNKKAITDITEIPAKDGKCYVSVIFDCYDKMALGISISDNMKADLCAETLKNAVISHPELKGAIIHSDRGSQYTSGLYREKIAEYGIIQSMNSAGGRCHDNARCESMWARMKEEVFYSRDRKSKNYTVFELKSMIWRYFMSYWNNRRIFTDSGLPPAEKRRRYYKSMKKKTA